MVELSTRQEHSVVQSLAMLRQLEVERVQEEAAARSALAAAVQAKQVAAAQALAAAAQASVDAEAAQRHAAQQAELARAVQLRQAEQAAFAAEAARQAEQLANHRVRLELELACSLAAKKRPRWMMAAAIVAMLGVSGTVAFALDRTARADAAATAQLQADAQRSDANAQRKAQYAKVGEFETRLGDTQSKLDAALAGIAAADAHAAQAAQQQKIAAQRQAAAAEQARINKAKADAWHKERNTTVEITDYCKTHALAQKCTK